MNRIRQGLFTAWKNISAAPFDAAEKEALLTTVCSPNEQSDGLRSLTLT